MAKSRMNSLVGITDFDEGTNLSCYLIQHGWNAEHACSADEVLSDVEEGGYGLVVIDEEILLESNWSLPDYLEAIGSETRTIILTEAGSPLQSNETLLRQACRFLQHPYTFESLRLAIEAEAELEPEYSGLDDSLEEFVDAYSGELEEEESDSFDLEDLI